MKGTVKEKLRGVKSGVWKPYRRKNVPEIDRRIYRDLCYTTVRAVGKSKFDTGNNLLFRCWPEGLNYADSMGIYFVLGVSALRAFSVEYSISGEEVSMIMVLQAMHRLKGKRFLSFRDIKEFTHLEEQNIRILLGDLVLGGYVTASQVEPGRRNKFVMGKIRRLPAQYFVNAKGHALILAYMDKVLQLAEGNISGKNVIKEKKTPHKQKKRKL